jgi:transposase
MASQITIRERRIRLQELMTQRVLSQAEIAKQLGVCVRTVHYDMQALEMAFAPISRVVVELRQQGLSLREIARKLDRLGIESSVYGWWELPKGRDRLPWTEAQVRKVLLRAGRDAFAAGKVTGGASPAGTADLASGPDGR